jgi:type IV secretory pathway protease TraF
VVLLSPAPDGFDSRYFGPLTPERLVGTAVPIATLPWPD